MPRSRWSRCDGVGEGREERVRGGRCGDRSAPAGPWARNAEADGNGADEKGKGRNGGRWRRRGVRAVNGGPGRDRVGVAAEIHAREVAGAGTGVGDSADPGPGPSILEEEGKSNVRQSFAERRRSSAARRFEDDGERHHAVQKLADEEAAILKQISRSVDVGVELSKDVKYTA